MRDVRQVGLEHLRCAREFRAQLRPLGGDPNRTGIEVAGAHHDATFGQQRRGAEAVLVSAQQRGDHDVAAGLDTAIDAKPHAPPQPAAAQRLLGLSQADLPRHAGVLDRRQWAGARPPIRAGDVNDIGQPFDDAGRDGAHA